VTDTTSALSRRGFLTGGLVAAAATGLSLGSPFSALASATDAGRPTRGGGYGPLQPTLDRTTGLPLLALPRGFEYVSFGWTGDPLADGSPTPNMHDGMGAFRVNGKVRLVRNHERGAGTQVGGGSITAYDGAQGGGNTTVMFDPDRGEYEGAYASLAGTIRNCAGGPTPWGTWLSCEENTSTSPMRHGYTFEVPADGVSDAQPLRAMGRFNKEAAAVDQLGFVYQTEDRSPGGFYRFTPATPGRLADGGVLEMLKVADGTILSRDLRGEVGTGETLPVEWVTIDEPDPATDSVRTQGITKGAARFARPEGCWYGNGLVYFACTSGGAARQGQIFAYDPVESTLTCVFESPARAVLNAPDNICVSPRGGLVLCEDGGAPQMLHGLSAEGEIFPFAQNTMDLRGTAGVNGFTGNYQGSEWAGACFDVGGGGNWLFVNLQSPGVTFAITGPWRQGIL
jgi:uncharacterized protein